MQFTIISGSHRLNSQSYRVGKYIEKQLLNTHQSSEIKEDNPNPNKVFLLDLAKTKLPLWSDQKEEWVSIWNPIAEKLSESDAFVLITPEYNGMATAILKNFLLFCSNKELGDKPATIVSVSAGRSGGYPISDLRSYGFKNTKLLYIPDHIIVRKVHSVLNEDDTQNDTKENEYIQKQMEYTLKKLYLYTSQMKGLREKLKLIDPENKFPHGM